LSPLNDQGTFIRNIFIHSHITSNMLYFYHITTITPNSQPLPMVESIIPYFKLRVTMSKHKPSKRGVYESAGGLLRRVDAGIPKLAVVHRPAYNDWTLPKGTLKKNETFQSAALREVREETACEASLGEFAGCTGYIVFGIPKIVMFWHMSLVTEHPFIPNDEIDALVWLPIDEAIQRLSYSDERNLLKTIKRS